MTDTRCCTDCATPLTGPWCGHCGLRQPVGRFGLPALFRDLWDRIVNLETGFVRTLWGILRNPRTTITGWFDGKRRTYMHPFALLLICATLSLLSVQFFGDAFWQDFKATMAEISGIQNPVMRERFATFYGHAFALMPYWMMLFCFPLALCLRVLFPKRGYTIAELWAVSLYAIALGIAIDIPFSMVLIAIGVPMSTQMLVTNGILMGFQIIVQGRFIATDWTGWVRVFLASFLGYPLAGALQQTIAFTYAYS